jgi:ABC-2 type transport system ATP-binding protein
MRQLGQKQLALSLQQPLAAVPANLAQWPLALSSDGLTLTYSFDVQKDDTGIADLLAALGAQGIHFKDLRSSESSLEEIFAGLVNDPARHATPATPEVTA